MEFDSVGFKLGHATSDEAKQYAKLVVRFENQTGVDQMPIEVSVDAWIDHNENATLAETREQILAQGLRVLEAAVQAVSSNNAKQLDELTVGARQRRDKALFDGIGAPAAL